MSSVVSSASRAVAVVIFVGSSPSFRIMTFFSHLAHQRVPFLSLKSGDAHAGQASSVRVAPWRSKFAMRLMGWSSVLFCGMFL